MKEKDQKRNQLKQAALAQQAALASAGNIYATTYASAPHFSTSSTMQGMPGSSASNGVMNAYQAGGVHPPFPQYTPYASMPAYPLLPVNNTGFLPLANNSAGVDSTGVLAQYVNAAPVQPASDVGLSLDPPGTASSTSLPLMGAVKAEPKPANLKPSGDDSDVEETAEEEEDEPNEPEVDEKQMAYSTMEGVKILSQPPILKAELHEHQVNI